MNFKIETENDELEFSRHYAYSENPNANVWKTVCETMEANLSLLIGE